MQAPVTSFRILACMYLPLLGALGVHKKMLTKKLLFGLAIIISLVSLSIVGAGYLGIHLNNEKLDALERNEIYLELVEKLESGEIKAENDLALLFVKGNKDIEQDTTLFVTDIYKILIIVGFTLLLLSIFQAFLIFKYVFKNKKQVLNG